MSGPVSTSDAAPTSPAAAPPSPPFEVIEGRRTDVAGTPVTRLLPRRARRMVGAWCFADHLGPTGDAAAPVAIGPHPHIGLQTVTWLFEGEVLHRDSLGSEQVIRPGQLNLMTAGAGVAHSEETPPGAGGAVHGLQLWVAQPESTRFGDPAFEHHPALPRAEPAEGVAATVLLGELAGARSPARADTPLVGADITVSGDTRLPLDPAFEHAVLVVGGQLEADGTEVSPGSLAYLGPGRDDVRLRGQPTARAVLVGGVPFETPVLMWWNFVARTTDEMEAAYRDWEAGTERFGEVRSPLPAMDAPPPSWRPQR